MISKSVFKWSGGDAQGVPSPLNIEEESFGFKVLGLKINYVKENIL